MNSKPICWNESQFPTPQHFQHSDRYWHEYMGRQLGLARRDNFGFSEIRIVQSSLRDWILEIEQLEGRFPDGTYFSFSGQVDLSEPREYQSIRSMVERNEPVDIFLTVPQSVQQTNAPQPDNRFKMVRGEISDVFSGQCIPAQLQELNLQLAFSTESLDQLEHLPLGRIELNENDQSSAVLNPHFVPPVLRIQSSTALLTKVSSLEQTIVQRLGEWSRAIETNQFAFANNVAKQQKFLFYASLLGEFRTWLHCQLHALDIHPADFFGCLCQWAGRLAPLHSVNAIGRLNELPSYHQLAPASATFELIDWIDQLLLAPDTTRIEINMFREQDGVMAAPIDQSWIEDNGCRIFFGLNLQQIESDQREHFVRNCFFNPDTIRWTLGSLERVRNNLADQGIKLHRLEQSKPNLPKRPVWLFAEFRPDQYWEEAKHSRSVNFGMDVNGSDDFNERLDGDQITVTTQGGSFTFQVALFAVKD